MLSFQQKALLVQLLVSCVYAGPGGENMCNVVIPPDRVGAPDRVRTLVHVQAEQPGCIASQIKANECDGALLTALQARLERIPAVGSCCIDKRLE